MKWYVAEEGSLVKLDEILTKNNQVALVSWKAGNKIDIGTWVLNFESSSGLGLKLGKLNYNGYEGTGWNKITDIEWVDITEDGALDFVLFLRYDKLKNPVTAPIDPENWMYKIYIKTKDESGEGKTEDEEIVYSVEFCSKRVFTEGPNKILGARCPFDPETGKYMEECLNWRRTDQVGSACRDIMDLKDRKKSIYNFCSHINANAADCKCINKWKDPEYVEEIKANKDHEHCWYFPCASGAYLTDKEGDKIPCNSKNCIIAYNTDHTGGDVKLYKNSSTIKCFNVESPPTGEYSLNKRKVFVILVILLFLFILFK